MEPAIRKDAEGNEVVDPSITDEQVLADGGTIVPAEQDDVEIAEKDDPKPVSDRDLMMENLAEKRKKQHAGLPTDQDQEEEEEIPTDIGDDAEDLAGKEMVELKVNGQVVHKTQAEVDAAGGIVAIQKNLAGDMKLAQAAEGQKQLEKDRGRVDQVISENDKLSKEVVSLRELVTTMTAQGEELSPESEEELKARAKTIADQFFLGDAEQLQTAVEQLLKAAQAPRPVVQAAAAPAPVVNEEEIARRVELGIEYKRNLREAQATFAKDNKDLDTDGRRSYVNDRTKEIVTSHPEWLPQQVIAEATRLTREQLNIPAPVAKKDPEKDLEDKKNRKIEAADQIPQATQRGKGRPQEKKPKTKGQIFEEIQSKRSHS